MYNDQLKLALQRGKVKGTKTPTKLFDTLGAALTAYYLNGGTMSRRIQSVMVTPGYAKSPSGRRLRAA